MIAISPLQNLHFFDGVSKASLETIANAAEEVWVEENQYVFYQRDEAKVIFVMLSGSVKFLQRIDKKRELLVGVERSPGALVGWSPFSPPYRYMTSLKTEEKSHFIRIPKTVIDEVFGSNSRDGYLLLSRVAITMSDRLNQVLSRLAMSIKTRPLRNKSADVEKEPLPEKFLTLNLIQQLAFTETFSTTHLKKMVRNGTVQSFEAGETIFEEGQAGTMFYLLIEGEINFTIYTQGKKKKAAISIHTISSPGFAVGWSALIAPHTYNANAITNKPTQMVALSVAFLNQLIGEDPSFGLALMRRTVMVISNRLTAARTQLVARRYRKTHTAVIALLDQNEAQLKVSSRLRKLPYYLANKLTLQDAFWLLEQVIDNGDYFEKNIAQLCLDLLEEMRHELGMYQRLQDIYETVAHAPRTMTPAEIRNDNARAFVHFFEQTNFEIRGMENLPENPGHIFIMNHLDNHLNNLLPNDFVLTLDSHFVAAMILYQKYGEAPVRVVRRASLDQIGHQKYYDRLGYIYVLTDYDRTDFVPNPQPRQDARQFFEDGKRHLLSGDNLVIAPEGRSTATRRSPQPFKAGAFRLANFVDPEPYIVPIAVANFDKNLYKVKTSAIIHPPFRLSDRIADPNDKVQLRAFLDNYHIEFSDYVKEAISAAQ